MHAHIMECAELAILCTCHNPRHVEVAAALEASRPIQASNMAHTHPVLGEHLGNFPLQEFCCGVPRGWRCGSLQHIVNIAILEGLCRLPVGLPLAKC